MSQFLYVHDCTASPITTSAYTEISSSTDFTASFIQFFYFKTDTSFGLVKLAIGEEGNEQDIVVCSQKVGTPINCYIPSGSRVCLKAIGSDVSTGYIIFCILT